MKSLLIILAVSATTAMAADVTGNWQGTRPKATAEMIFVFKIKGTKLTGKVSPLISPHMLNINNGKLDGDNLSFSTRETFVMSPTTVSDLDTKYTGTVSADGNEIKLKEEHFVRGQSAGDPIEWTVKRIP